MESTWNAWGSVKSSVSQAMPMSGTLSKTEIATILAIPAHWLRDPGNQDHDADLHTNYQKYQTVLNAVSTLTKLIKSGEWKGRKPAEIDIIDKVVSKSMWYSHHRKLFSKIAQYPDMQKWLRGDDDAPPSYDIWGEEKGSYTWGDLAQWLEEKGKRGKAKQGKAKEGKAKEEKAKEEKKKKDDYEEDTSKKSKKKKN